MPRLTDLPPWPPVYDDYGRVSLEAEDDELLQSEADPAAKRPKLSEEPEAPRLVECPRFFTLFGCNLGTRCSMAASHKLLPEGEGKRCTNCGAARHASSECVRSGGGKAKPIPEEDDSMYQ